MEWSGVYTVPRCYYSSTTTTTQGCLWNFPGANTTHWHRDYDDDWQLLTVITAAADYPQDVGWLLLQRGKPNPNPNPSPNPNPNPNGP